MPSPPCRHPPPEGSAHRTHAGCRHSPGQLPTSRHRASRGGLLPDHTKDDRGYQGSVAEDEARAEGAALGTDFIPGAGKPVWHKRPASGREGHSPANRYWPRSPAEATVLRGTAVSGALRKARAASGPALSALGHSPAHPARGTSHHPEQEVNTLQEHGREDTRPPGGDASLPPIISRRAGLAGGGQRWWPRFLPTPSLFTHPNSQGDRVPRDWEEGWGVGGSRPLCEPFTVIFLGTVPSQNGYPPSFQVDPQLAQHLRA